MPYRDGLAGRPRAVGPWAALHTRFRRWVLGGTFERTLQAAQARADAVGGIDWLVSIGTPASGSCSPALRRSCTRAGPRGCGPHPPVPR
ncbi:hypothetical protein NKH77_52435 [Streptomyces sp. M19]